MVIHNHHCVCLLFMCIFELCYGIYLLISNNSQLIPMNCSIWLKKFQFGRTNKYTLSKSLMMAYKCSNKWPTQF